MKKTIICLSFILPNIVAWIWVYRSQYDLLMSQEIYVILVKFLPSVLTSFVSFLAAYLIFLKTKKKEDMNKIKDQENIRNLLVISFSEKLVSLKKIESEIVYFKDKNEEVLKLFFIDKSEESYFIFNKAINGHIDYIQIFPEDKFTDKVMPSDLESVYSIYSSINVLLIRTQFILNISSKSEIPLLIKYIKEYNDTIQLIETRLESLKKVNVTNKIL